MTPDQQRCANWGSDSPIGSTAKPNPKRSFRLFNLDQCGSSMVDYWFNAAMVMALNSSNAPGIASAIPKCKGSQEFGWTLD